jgi:predicted nucleic acid-binding protein
MPTVIDANVLIALFTTGHEDKRDARIRGLIKDTRAARGRLVIPSPALAEFSVGASDAELDFLNSQSIFKIAPFDAVTALECGFLIRDVFARDGKKNRQKIKFDLQILAIAKAQGARRLITNDEQLRKRAIQFGIQGIDLTDLPIPDDERQMLLALRDAQETSDD